MPITRTTFRLWAGEVLSPTVLTGEFGHKLAVGTLGLVWDMIAETYRQAVKSWILLSREFPSDALALMGDARNMPRYPNENDDGYKFRLHHAWTTWQQAGTPQSVKNHLELGLGWSVEVEENHTWNWDGDASKHARAWFIVRGHGFEPLLWGDGHAWGSDGTWGSSATPADVNAVRSIVRLWKNGHLLAMIVIVMDDAQWDADAPPDGSWGNPVNRSEGAIYWLG